MSEMGKMLDEGDRQELARVPKKQKVRVRTDSPRALMQGKSASVSGGS